MASQRPEADAAHWRALFLDMLRKTGNVSAAARHAGWARSTPMTAAEFSRLMLDLIEHH
jgi:hypothetical protein